MDIYAVKKNTQGYETLQALHILEIICYRVIQTSSDYTLREVATGATGQSCIKFALWWLRFGGHRSNIPLQMQANAYEL